MGIDYTTAKFLAEAHKAGAPFISTLTLGRMSWLVCPPHARKLGIEHPPTYGAFAEPFFRSLGAQRIESLDCSPYEEATIIHDLNQWPLFPKDEFDAVIDCGTLEHVFNLPIAFQTTLSLVRTGGSLFMVTPVNNHVNHGYYQFSPELIRDLLLANGFLIEKAALLRLGLFRDRIYNLSKPEVYQRGLITGDQVRLMVHAKKYLSVPFNYPQQPPHPAPVKPTAGTGLKLWNFCREFIVHNAPWLEKPAVRIPARIANSFFFHNR
jgi:hypothetical protein